MQRTRLGLITLAVAAIALLGVPQAFATNANETIFSAKSPDGQVWVSVDLTRQRLNEDYVPLLVTVQNTAGQPITLDRDSFTLIGSDHQAETMPDVPTLRKAYGKFGFDRTVLRLYGMPFGTLLDLDHAEPSDFFPAMTPSSSVRIDNVVLNSLDWTTDVLYFKRPAGIAQGREVTLKIQPKGWEMPITVPFHVG